MIVRAKTPKGLSWAGRIAVLGMAALILPLAPSWARNDESNATAANGLTGIELSDPQPLLDTSLAAAELNQQGNEQSSRGDLKFEARIIEEFQKDPGVQTLVNEINEIRERIDSPITLLLLKPTDPAKLMAKRELDRLQKQYRLLWEEKYDQIRRRVFLEAGPTTVPDGTHGLRSKVAVLVRKKVADKTIEDRITEDLKTDPELIALTREIDKARDDASRRASHDFAQRLEQRIAKLGNEIDAKKDELKQLIKKGRVTVLKPQETIDTKNMPDSSQLTFKTLSAPQTEQMISEIVRNDLELSDAQSLLEVKLAADKANKQSPLDEQKLETRIKEEFNKDPEVQALVSEIHEVRDHLEHAKKLLRQTADPALREAQKRLAKMENQHKLLWEQKYAEIRGRLTAATGVEASGDSVRELKSKVDRLMKKKEKLAAIFKELQVYQKESNDDTFEATFLNHELATRMNWEEQARKNLEQLKFEAHADEQRLSDLIARRENLQKQKHDQLLALLTKDDGKDKDDKEEKTRDAAEHFQDQLKDLIEKLGKQFSPVTEEIRKALDQAVGEVHKSLEKESLSVEELRKALEKSQQELRKGFEGGGPVDKELRDAIERLRKELQDALERGKAEVQDQVEALRM